MSSPSDKHLPVLDGVRAVAILLVLGFHQGLPLGFAGVNLFFTLSGFLITGILIDTKNHPHYFRGFYIRRVLRIFPIYYLLVIVLAIAFREKPGVIGELPWFLTYTQNILQIRTSFFNAFPLVWHTWSLAVEEQFYLIWPYLVWRSSEVGLRRLCLFLIVLCPLVRLAFWFNTPNPFWQNNFLPSQLDGFAMGALAASLLRSGRSARSLYLGAVRLGTIGFLTLVGLFPVLHLDNPRANVAASPFGSLLFTAIYLFSTSCLIILVLPAEQGRVAAAGAAVLSHRWSQHIGRISYGLYVYHPVVWWQWESQFFRWAGWPWNKVPQPFCFLGMFAVLFVVSDLSWRLVERPILKLKQRLAPREEKQPSVN